jgi:hypothetical protein
MNLHLTRLRLRTGFLFPLMTLVALGADDPKVSLHERIDRIIDAARVGPPVALTGDAEFLRRVSLDLTGMPPSTEELRDFLTDTSKLKRAAAVDRLLESPLFSRHLATSLDLMLMERRPNQNVSVDEWQNYLLKACRENRPLNLVLKEVLNADGSDANLRPAARFYLDRGSEPNLITRDVARIFFGRDLQCAQCHNHPLIDDYQQSDYHGLLAFFRPAYALTRKEGGKDKTFYAEKAGDDLTFDSVFVKNDKHMTGPRILGEIELVEPVFPPGEEYQVKPADNVLPVPKFSRRLQLASLATAGSNQSFNENVANRLWAMLMGRGLVHPLDLHHPANPPSHPELMKLLADEIVAMKFNAKAFLRELALSQTFQRVIDLPLARPEQSAEIASSLAELVTHSEPLTAASKSAQEGYDQAVKAWHTAENALVPAAAEHDKALAKYSEAAKKQADAQKGVNQILATIAARQDVAKTLADAASKVQEAVKKLPNEKDLSAAAQKFVDRSKAIATELVALEKTSAEKSSALKKTVEAVASAVKPVEEARAKALPLREIVREKEKIVLAARKSMVVSRIALERHKNRVRLLEAYAQRIELEKQAEASASAILGKREAVVRAQKIANDHAAGLPGRNDAVKDAEKNNLAAESAAKDARAALERQQKIVASVVEAFNATDVARQQLPDDETLAETAAKLKTKADDLRSVSAGLKAKVDAVSTDLKKSADALASVRRARDEFMAEKTRLDGLVALAQKALADEESHSKAIASEIAAISERLTTLMGDHFQTAQLKPLSPEQMYWSILKVTGVYDRQKQTEEAELDKTKPMTPETNREPAQIRARAFEVEDRTFAKLKGNVAAFVRVYGAGAGQPQSDFFATADQALFVANGGLVNGWVAPAASNISDRMVREKDLNIAAEDLYLTVLSRRPTPDETAEVVRVLSEQAATKPASVQEWVWGLLTSAEFRFNH